MAVWTQEQDDRLRDLAAGGASAHRIAAALNRKIQIVRRRARDLGYHVPTVREQRMLIQNAENERREYRSEICGWVCEEHPERPCADGAHACNAGCRHACQPQPSGGGPRTANAGRLQDRVRQGWLAPLKSPRALSIDAPRRSRVHCIQPSNRFPPGAFLRPKW